MRLQVIIFLVLFAAVSAATYIFRPMDYWQMPVRMCQGDNHYRAFTFAARDIEPGVTLTAADLKAGSGKTFCCYCEACKRTNWKIGRGDQTCEDPHFGITTSPRELIGLKTTAKIKKNSMFNHDNLDTSSTQGFVDGCICEKVRISKGTGLSAKSAQEELRSLGFDSSR